MGPSQTYLATAMAPTATRTRAKLTRPRRHSHASIRFHEKMGFRRVGTIDAIGWKFGRWLDSILMQRALGEGSESSPE